VFAGVVAPAPVDRLAVDPQAVEMGVQLAQRRCRVGLESCERALMYQSGIDCFSGSTST
jgi:hypothetical protein